VPVPAPVAPEDVVSVAVTRATALAGPSTVVRGVKRGPPASLAGAPEPLAVDIVSVSPLEVVSASGKLLNPTSGTAMAPMPSTPAQRPAAIVPANLRSRPVVDERLGMFRSVMSESPCRG
jgi:hypothetical protein